MVLLELDNCGGGGSGTVAIVYRPKLQAGEDNSTLSYLFGLASGTVLKRAATLQFNGSGSYVGSFVTGRASTRTNSGRFDLTVRPAEVTPATDFVTFTGSFTNFVGLDRCMVEVRGAASHLSRWPACPQPSGASWRAAATQATALMLTMPRLVTEALTMWAGWRGPIRIGPMVTAPVTDLIRL